MSDITSISCTKDTAKKFNASKDTYSEKCGMQGTNDDFLGLVLDSWDNIQKKEAEAK